MGSVANVNLAHVLQNDCTDPDCELHNVEVAIEEETVNMTDVAFFLAGAQAGAARGYDRVIAKVLPAIIKKSKL